MYTYIRVKETPTQKQEEIKMIKFEIGKQYTHGWAGDSDLFTTWEVIKRTAQTIKK